MSDIKIKPGLSDDWDPAWELKLSDEEREERDAEIAALEKANFGSGPEYDLDLHLARPIG